MGNLSTFDREINREEQIPVLKLKHVLVKVT